MSDTGRHLDYRRNDRFIFPRMKPRHLTHPVTSFSSTLVSRVSRGQLDSTTTPFLLSHPRTDHAEDREEAA